MLKFGHVGFFLSFSTCMAAKSPSSQFPPTNVDSASKSKGKGFFSRHESAFQFTLFISEHAGVDNACCPKKTSLPHIFESAFQSESGKMLQNTPLRCGLQKGEW